MDLLYYFFNYKIPFYIYKIDKGESITYTLQYYQNKWITILCGVVYLMKVFNNKEVIGLGILHNKNIIAKQNDKRTFCQNYAITALKTTFLLVCELDHMKNTHDIKGDFLRSMIIAYNNTLYKYEMMSNILSHKSCRNRLIQLILYLCQEFAVIDNNNIIIPFYISQITLSIIIGCNKSTIHKLMQELSDIQIITYSYQKYICIKDPSLLRNFQNNKTQNKT